MGAKELLLQVAKYDYLYEYTDGTWKLNGGIVVKKDECESLVQSGDIEMNWGNEVFTAWKISVKGYETLKNLESKK